MIDLEIHEPVHVLRMRAGENRFAPDFLDAFESALDRVEAAGRVALVTVGDGKFYSNGLDLAWMGGPGRDSAGELLARVLRLFGRLLTFPVPTVAAVNGHAFAAGAMLALVHDVRLMRADRGFVCLPEVDLGLPLHPGMTAVVTARVPAATAHDAIVSGRRYGGEDAVACGLMDGACPEDDLLPRARAEAAARAGKDPGTLAALKRGLYPNTLAALGVPVEAAPGPGVGG